MNPIHLPRRRATLLRVTAAFALPLAGCSATSPATFRPAAQAVLQDATSPAGRQLLADVTTAALHVGLGLAAGRDTEAAVAGLQGAASAVRDYEGLPVSPASTMVAQAAALGSGVARVAAALTPGVRDPLENAHRSAAQQNVRVTTDDLIEAVARGFDAVAANQRTPTHL